MRKVLFIFLLSIATTSQAIDGLQIHANNGNIVLSWPSSSSQTYIVQYRESLDSTSLWQTLESSLQGVDGTTYYTNFNRVPLVAPLARVNSNSSLSAQSLGRTLETTDSSSPPMPPVPWDTSTWPWLAQTSENQTLTALSTTPPIPGSGQIPQYDTNPVAPPTYRFYRVAQNGVRLIGIPNGATLWGELCIPIEVGTVNTNSITGITLLANGNPVIGASIGINTTGNYELTWNTSFIPNGTYSINAQINFEYGDAVTNNPITLTIQNVVSFPLTVSHTFGDQMWIYAELVIPNAYYEIQMFADDTSNIGTFSGYTTNGIISLIWDLSNQDRTTIYTNNSFTGEFYIYSGSPRTLMRVSSLSSSSCSGKITWAKETQAPQSQNSFIVAWGAIESLPQSQIKQDTVVGRGVVDIIGALSGPHYKLSPGNIPEGATFRVANSYNRESLLDRLNEYEYRNFYWLGHGSASSISALEPGTTITETDIRHEACNFPSSNRPANYKPFRFVFLDSCESAKGTLCEAFGISPQTLTVQHFINAGVRPRAFLGYKDKVTFNFAQYEYRQDMLVRFWQDWMDGNTLAYCVQRARSFTLCPMDSSWIIYGATDMTRYSW